MTPRYENKPEHTEGRMAPGAALDCEARVLEAALEERASPEQKKGFDRRKVRKAFLHAVSVVALFGSTAAFEARAQSQVFLRAGGGFEIKTTPEKRPEKVAENKKKAEKLRKEVEGKKLNEEVAYLEPVYGDAVKNLLHQIKHAQTEFQWDARGNAEALNAQEAELAMLYDLFWDRKKILKRAEERKKMPDIYGFEALPGWSDKRVRKVLSEFPSELVSNVDEVRYVDEIKENIHFSVAAEAYDVGVTGTVGHEKGNAVLVYKPKTENISEAEMKNLLAHEVAHDNDWRSSVRLTMPERVRLLADMTKWLLDPDRPKNHFVDEIIPKEYRDHGWSEQEMKYRQARELFAESYENFHGVFTADHYAAFKRKIENREILPRELVLADQWATMMRLSSLRKIDAARSLGGGVSFRNAGTSPE